MTPLQRTQLEKVKNKSNGLLEYSYICGQLYGLQLKSHSSVTITYKYGAYPYRVRWKTSRDRRDGLGIETVYRSRSFRYPGSLLQFIQGF